MADPKFEKLIDVDKLALFKDKQDAANAAAYAAKADFDEYKSKVDGLETTGGQPNVIEGVKVNDAAVMPVDKVVSITVPTDNASLANGAGYQTASDVASAISGKADASSLGTAAAASTEAAVADDDGLPTGAAVKSFVEGKGYQTESQVATKVEGYGYQTAAQVESAIADKGYQTASDVTAAINGAIASAMDYKGTKAAKADLPASGNKTGDVWHVTADGSEYAWDGSEWQELGVTVSLSGYAQEADFSIASNADINALFASAGE